MIDKKDPAQSNRHQPNTHKSNTGPKLLVFGSYKVQPKKALGIIVAFTVVALGIVLYANAMSRKSIKFSFSSGNEISLGDASCSTNTGAMPTIDSRYQLVWEDQFNGSSLNLRNWNYFIGQGSTPNVNYVADTVSVAGGDLKISTYTENNKHYSGWITTENKYQPKYGYYEARIKSELADKISSAFWLFNPTVNKYGDPWNNGVELDIVEHGKTDYLGQDIGNQAASNLNWGQYGNDWDNHPSLGSGLRGANLANGYHTYSMEWTPDSQKFYIDGQYLWEIINSSVTPVSQRDEFLVLSHEVGGDSSNNYGPRTNPGSTMNIDYVKVCQLSPVAPPAPTNLARSGGSGSATLTWRPSANANSYIVKRSLNPGGPYTALDTISELSYTDTTASSSNAYYYTVSAINSTGESSPSAEVVVQPNIALGKAVVASTQRQAARNATDANTGSIWESDWAQDPQWIYIDLGSAQDISTVIAEWDHAYAKTYRLQVSNDANSWRDIYGQPIASDGGSDELKFASTNTRYVRIFGVERAHTYVSPSPFGYAIKEFEVFASLPSPSPANLAGYTNKQSVKLQWQPSLGATSYNIKRATQSGGPYTTVATGLNATNYVDSGLINGTTYFHIVTAVTGNVEGIPSNEVRTTPRDNIALWQQTYASSKENADTRPFKLVDGKTETFSGITTTWSSLPTDNQWIYIDLQTQYQINKLMINWDRAARTYEVQISNDSVNWQTVYTESNSDGGVDTPTFTPASTRYVRLLGKKSALSNGYSIKELEIYTP